MGGGEGSVTRHFCLLTTQVTHVVQQLSSELRWTMACVTAAAGR